MRIEERQLLLAVRRIIRGIQIDGDPASATMQTLAMPLNHAVGQRFRHAKQLFAIRTIFKAREGRLRSQIFPFHGIPTDQEFVHRVASQAGRVIGIFVSTGDGHDPLR